MPTPAELPLEIDCATTQQLLGKNSAVFFLDCREPDEYQTARITGAKLIPMSELQQRAEELDEHRDRQIIVHCHHGGRSLRVARWLRAQGFASAQSMKGGIDEWSQQIDPSVPRY